MKTERFQKIVEYLLDNLFDIVTILVAGALVIRHELRPFTANDIGDLATWILAVLGLIAVSGLWDRNRRMHRIERFAKEGRDLAARYLSGRVRAGDFFLSEQPVSAKTFAAADTIYFLGMTLTRTTREYMHMLGQRLEAGASIRFVILETEEPLLQELVERSFGQTTIDYWKNRLDTVKTVIEVIAKSSLDSKGDVKLGRLPFTPSFGFTMIDPDEPHGVCFVELYHHKSAEPNPVFELRASEDAYWYDFFRNQFEILWNSCRLETLHECEE